MLKRKIVVTALIAAIFLISLQIVFPQQTALACSCAGPDNLEDAYDKYSHVFVGTAEKREEASISFIEQYVTAFQVKHVYKGELGEKSNVYSADASLGCGMYFEEGVDYVVFAHLSDNRLITLGCSFSQEASDQLLDQLNKAYEAKAPLTVVDEGIESDSEPLAIENDKTTTHQYWLVGLSFAAVLFFTLFLVYIRNKTSKK